MGASIALDISASTNTQPITETRNAIALTTDEAREFGRILVENNNNLDIAAKKFFALKDAAQSAAQELQKAAVAPPNADLARDIRLRGLIETVGAPIPGGGKSGAAPQLGPAIPPWLQNTNRQLDAMDPRIRTATAAMSRLAFEASNMGGSVQGAVRSAGMLTYSLAGMSNSAAVAGSAAGIGAVTIAIAAGLGMWDEWHQKMEDARRQLDAINASAVGSAAQLQGNQLGARETQLADSFDKQVAELKKKYQPGWLMRTLGWLQEATMSGTGIANDPSKSLITALGNAVYGPTGEHALAVQQDAMRKALANAGALAAGAGDPVTRYRAQLHLIEVERDQAIKKGELSAEAANARAHEQRRLLVKRGYDLEQTLGEEVYQHLAAARRTNVFERQQEAEDARFKKEMEDNALLTLSFEAYQAAVNLTLLKHQAITAEIAKQRKETETQARIQAGQGDLNPITRARAEIAAIEERRKKAVEAGAKEVDAAKIAENEKRNLYAQTLDVAVRSSQSLGKVLTQAALNPIVTYLEGLSIQEGIKAIADAASFNIAGAALHTAAAAAAFAGAREVAQLGGLSSGGGGSGGGGGGGVGQFVPGNNIPNGGGTTVIIQTVDPSSKAVINQTIYEINRSGMLNTPIVAPYGRPS